ncbi:hypothetical protein PMAYCL1PPCAC_09527, partial [Pristionchus mayeri]
IKLRVHSKNIDTISGINLTLNHRFLLNCNTKDTKFEASEEWGAALVDALDEQSPNDAYCTIHVDNRTEMCGVDGSCIKGGSGFVFPTTTTVEPDCPAGVWISPLSTTKWMVKLLVRNKKIDLFRGVSIVYQKAIKKEGKAPTFEPEQAILGCHMPDEGNGILDIISMLGLEADFHQTHKSRLTRNFAYCEILITNTNQLPFMNDGKMHLSFVMSAELNNHFYAADTFDTIHKLARCDPYQMRSVAYKDGTMIKLE